MFFKTRIRLSVFSKLVFPIIITAGFPLLTVWDSCAQNQKPGEYQVKTAFLYNFAKFVEWPQEEALDIITLCVLGEDPFNSALDGLQGKTIRGKRLLVKRIKSFKNLGQGHILFISASEKDKIPQIVQTLKDSSILTVGDTEGFAQRGVMINFYLEQNKVRFEINPHAVRRSGLRISSNLLKLARIVSEAP